MLGAWRAALSVLHITMGSGGIGYEGTGPSATTVLHICLRGTQDAQLFNSKFGMRELLTDFVKVHTSYEEATQERHMRLFRPVHVSHTNVCPWFMQVNIDDELYEKGEEDEVCSLCKAS